MFHLVFGYKYSFCFARHTLAAPIHSYVFYDTSYCMSVAFIFCLAVCLYAYIHLPKEPVGRYNIVVVSCSFFYGMFTVYVNLPTHRLCWFRWAPPYPMCRENWFIIFCVLHWACVYYLNTCIFIYVTFTVYFGARNCNKSCARIAFN